MTRIILKNEITNDPENLDYSGKTDKQVADLLNIKNRTEFIDVKSELVIRYIIRKNKWVGILGSTEVSAKNLMGLLVNTSEFDTNGTSSTAIFDSLISLSLLDTANKTTLQNMGQQLISRAQELNLPKIKVGWVEKVRS